MRRRPVTQRGSILIYMIVVMTVLMAFCSLAVDWGRVQLVRTELRLAADAAARHAALGLATGVSTVEARAVDAANDNTADGTPVALTVTSDANTTDVQFGTWDAQARTFTLLSGASRSSANAVRVHCRRTKERGNAVPLLFAQVLGRSSSNATASATALLQPGAPVGIIGLQRLEMDSGARTDSYDSSVAPYSASWGPDRGSVTSNGDIWLDSGTLVAGDARPGPGRSATGGTVTGSRTPSASLISFPPVSAAPYGPSNNDNAQIPPGNQPGGNFSLGPSQSVNVPAGTYYFRNFRMGSNSVLNVLGPVTIYVDGQLDMGPGSRTVVARPRDLWLRVVGSGEVELDGGAVLHAQLEAPSSKVEFDDNVNVYGSVVARELEICDNARVHFDESLQTGARGNPSVSLVR